MVNEWDVTMDELFDLFWQMYPRKVGKKLCQQIWKKKINRDMVDDIYTGLRKLRTTPQWTQHNGQYIPHPSTFLNQERWNDEVPQQECEMLNIKEPHTTDEVYIALLLNSFGIKTAKNTNEQLVQIYMDNAREINTIKAYCQDIVTALPVIDKVREDLEGKGFTWTWRSIASNFPFHLSKYEKEIQKHKRYN